MVNRQFSFVTPGVNPGAAGAVHLHKWIPVDAVCEGKAELLFGSRPFTFTRNCRARETPMRKEASLACLIFLLGFDIAYAQDPSEEIAESDLAPSVRVGNDRLRFTTGVRTIVQSRNGDYWFGSQSEGLCRYDGKSFEYFGVKQRLPSKQVVSIQEDQQGTVWIGTLHGVCRFDGKRFEQVQQTRSSVAYLRLPSTVQNEWQKKEDDLWFNAGVKQGVYRYDGQQLRYLPFPNSITAVNGNTYSVTGFSRGKKGVLWIATYAGVFGFDGNNFTKINDETLGLAQGDARIHVRSILEDSKGRLWIGNNGIGVLLKQGESISNFSRQQGKLMPMEEFHANTRAGRFTANVGLQSIFAIAEDSDGNIWFGDRDTGAWRYDGVSLVNYSVDPMLESQMIWDIYEDSEQRLLFAMASGGVYEFKGKSFERRF